MVARYKSSLNKVFNDEVSRQPEVEKDVRTYHSIEARDILNHKKPAQLVFEANMKRASLNQQSLINHPVSKTLNHSTSISPRNRSSHVASSID